MIVPAEVAARHANEKGGILGRQIKTISEDSRSDPATAVSALRKLIDVDNILADFSSFTALIFPQLPIAEENQVIVFGPGVAHPDFTKSAWAVRMALTGDRQAKKTAEIATALGVKTAVYLSEDNDSGRVMQRVFDAEFTKLGGRLLATETFKVEANDMRGQLTKLKSFNPDAFYFMGSTSRPIALILKQMVEVGFHPKRVFDTYLMETAEVQSLSPELTEGAIWVTLEMDSAFAQQFKAELGYEPDTASGDMYGSMQLLVEAIKRVGGTDRTKVRDAIFNFGEFKSPVGTFTFAGSGEPEVGLIVRTMKAGKIVEFKP
jgi:branched-chain amino acid transport system substrate-binding protein